MNISISTIYGDTYARDRLFDVSACNIGENLLVPGAELQKALKRAGHEYHTFDMYDVKDIDIAVFQDINKNYIRFIRNPIDLAKYILKGKRKRDDFEKAVKNLDKSQMVLVMQEPAVVSPESYRKENHKYFDKILTWDDSLVDNRKYYKFFYPQPVPQEKFGVPFKEKRLVTLIAGNKRSNDVNELYSHRRKAIDFFEKNNYEFDLYGFGWETENLKCYKGSIDKKLQVLSGYKYAICYENMCNISGYITEKIFDCFFANCVPIYWGADNIYDYIPKGTFIDRNDFDSLEQLYDFLINISESRYNEYLRSIRDYLNSSSFAETFSVDAYINNFIKVIVGK